ncbi:uncharacterized protein LOC144112391 [Amblyomma americanum]
MRNFKLRLLNFEEHYAPTATNELRVSSRWVIEVLKPFQVPKAAAGSQSSRVPGNGRPRAAVEPALQDVCRFEEEMATKGYYRWKPAYFSDYTNVGKDGSIKERKQESTRRPFLRKKKQFPERPPSSSADALPDHWEAPASSGRNLPEEPSSREELHDEKRYNGSRMVARADCTSDTALADVKSEERKEDTSLIGMSMFEFLTSGKSTVKGVPVGVFTLKALDKGLHFGPYHGVKVDVNENGGCTWPVRRCGEFFVVDGRPEERNHWMNDVNYSPSKRRQNLVALLSNGDVYYRTLRNILPNEELLVGYSTSFAKSLLGNPRGPGALKEEDVNLIPLHSLLFACEKCGDLFTTQYNMEMHTRQKHCQSTQGISHCTHCTYTSSRKSDIIRHERTHADNRNYVCNLCQKRFSRPDNLKVHMAIHTRDKPYECGQCGKRFRQHIHAKHHEQIIHFRRYPLHCPRCGAGAENVAKLRRHTCKPLGTTEGKEGVKGGRGRPRLKADGTAPTVRPRNTTEGTPLQGGVKRGRGRPRKAVAQDVSTPRP